MTLSRPDEVQPIYERLPEESSKSYAKFLIYRTMKPDKRSLFGSYVLHQEQGRKGSEKAYKNVPGSWRDLAMKYDWKARAEAYDAHLQAEQEAREAVLREIEAAEIEQILTSDYALMHKRISGLSNMAKLIEKSFFDEETQKVEFKWLSPDKVREYRGCLDDIAKELGQRVKKNEVTGKGGGPIEFVTEWGGGMLEEDNEEGG